MFERFTDRARRVIVLAQEEARMLSHGYIGTEHLLLGLIHEGGGVSGAALESLSITLDDARAQVVAIVPRGQEPLSGHIPFTPRAKKILELSLREALDLGHSSIGPEHILLGIVREGQGVANQVLANLGANGTGVRAAGHAVHPATRGRELRPGGRGGDRSSGCRLTCASWARPPSSRGSCAGSTRSTAGWPPSSSTWGSRRGRRRVSPGRREEPGPAAQSGPAREPGPPEDPGPAGEAGPQAG